jgi:hypothetical protein
MTSHPFIVEADSLLLAGCYEGISSPSDQRFERACRQDLRKSPCMEDQQEADD